MPEPPSNRPQPPQPQPQPKPQLHPSPPEPGIGSGSATGFVSMLAHRQFDAPPPTNSLEALARAKDQLHMAREIRPTPDTPPTTPPTAIPTWYAPTAIASLILAALLALIGLWAIGALLYMHQVSPLSPRQVHYPLLRWSLDAGPLGDYTPASRLMAWSMLACLPVAALLTLIATRLRRRRPESRL